MTEASDRAINIVPADLSRPEHQEVILQLLDDYSRDPMGDGHPLSETTRRDLIPGLKNHPTTAVFLAFAEESPVGLAICFRGFSTFAARPLLNLHDFYVAAPSRGAGIGRKLMNAVEAYARAAGCCRLTLEVQENNSRARGIYAAAGFQQMVYVPEAGGSLSLSKSLD